MSQFVTLKCDLCKEREVSEQVCINREWKGACKECANLHKTKEREYASNRN